LACAPTNTAILQLADRLHGLVQGSFDYKTYGLGDMVLMGNKSRMRLDSFQGLQDVFLDHRVKNLAKCFAPLSGWKHSVESMIHLLEDPEKEYSLYEKEEGGMSLNDFVMREYIEVFRGFHDHLSTIIGTMTLGEYVKQKHNDIFVKFQSIKEKKNILTIEQFIKQRFQELTKNLKFCMQTFYTHLPTSFISRKQVKNMFEVTDLLDSVEARLKVTLSGFGERKISSYSFGSSGTKCLNLLSLLSESISLSNDIQETGGIEKFCLLNACIILCTASGSTKLNTVEMNPIKFLVIDEAAQLKECESAIPLKLRGLNHCILIGDEKQLPALVKSKVLSLNCANLLSLLKKNSYLIYEKLLYF